MRLRPKVRVRDKGAATHLVDGDDPTGVALCGRPGPWAPAKPPQPKRCTDCETSHQRQTNHVGGRVWAGL